MGPQPALDFTTFIAGTIPLLHRAMIGLTAQPARTPSTLANGSNESSRHLETRLHLYFRLYSPIRAKAFTNVTAA
jgi:hypothetical protein